MIDYSVDSDGIATLSWNVSDRSMNVMHAASIEAFSQALEKAVADPAVRGLLVTSARKEFIAGGDLDLIRRIQTVEESLAASGPVSRLLRRLETCGKPAVAAINGTALGGGLELALACHYRIVADDPKIQLGLPEVGLGLLPAAGGTQRLPRMIGIEKALPYLLEGRKVAPAAALKAGIVDRVVSRAELLDQAREWLLAADKDAAIQPWDKRGFRLPGGAPQTPGPTQVFFGVSAAVMGKTQGLYPAPAAILACVYDGCQVDIDTGLRIEQRQFANLATGVAAKNLIRLLFYSLGEANRLADRPANVPTREFSRVAVLGAGMMGAGLALVCAQAGLDVVLLDVELEAAERGKAYAAKVTTGQVEKGRLAESERDLILARIQCTTSYEHLQGCQLVIEAVFEDRQVKAEVTRRAEAAMDNDAILASNTSTLPITGLAQVAQRPERFVGLHFFSPVEKMPLVEVIRGEQTKETTVAYALDFVRHIRKTPIVVNDCPAFYANRAFGKYAFEALTLLGEGVNPALIENAGRMAGMPMPPLALIDEFSVELLYKAMKQAQADQGDRYVKQAQDPVITAMVEQLQRPGRKAGKGFYDYPASGGRQLWPGLAQVFPLASKQPTLQEVQQRLMLVQSVEAARCVDEEVVSPRDADVGALLGWGYPAVLGGVLGYIDTLGAVEFVAACDQLEQQHGERFRVPESLRRMAQEGARYHSI